MGNSGSLSEEFNLPFDQQIQIWLFLFTKLSIATEIDGLKRRLNQLKDPKTANAVKDGFNIEYVPTIREKLQKVPKETIDLHLRELSQDPCPKILQEETIPSIILFIYKKN